MKNKTHSTFLSTSLTVLVLGLVGLGLCALPASADDGGASAEFHADTIDLGPALRSYGQRTSEKAAILMGNNEPIQFETAAGTIDGTEIRRFGGNALRFRYATSSLIFDSLQDLPMEVRDSAGKTVYFLDPDGNAFFDNGGTMGVGTNPSATVKLDILSDSHTVGLRYRRTDAKDARILLADPNKAWSMAVGWATGGDFSIIEEQVSGNHFYIKQGGNVGLGTSQPTERLQVQGNIKLSGDIVSNGDICIGSGCP